MIKTLIIEDEAPAAERLELLLKQTDVEIEILEIIDSVSEAIKWLDKNPMPDLMMLDIQLADGLSFDIFRHKKIESFVIFTTAYDEYAIKAFELNSIDYLLKPVDKKKLAKSINKYKQLKSSITETGIQALMEMIESRKANYKKRFIINAGSRLISVESKDVLCFYSSHKDSYLINKEGKTYPVDFSLDRLEDLVDPDMFFRINRQFILHYQSIEQVQVLSKSRIKILPKFKVEDELLVSAGKSGIFREWLDK